MKNNKVWLAVLALVMIFLGRVPAQANDREVVAKSPGTYLATSTDSLTTAVTGGAGSYHYSMSFAVVTTASVVNLMVNDGTATRTFLLNSGTSCTAGVLYWQEFDFPGDWTLNVRVVTATTPVYTITRERNAR